MSITSEEVAVRAFLTFLPALVCGGMMAVCFWAMSRHTGPDDNTEIKELREEVERLRAEREPVDG